MKVAGSKGDFERVDKMLASDKIVPDSYATGPGRGRGMSCRSLAGKMSGVLSVFSPSSSIVLFQLSDSGGVHNYEAV